MKVLRTLQRQAADNLVALTYNLDLPFFESALLGPLQAAGCRNVALLCDPSQYQQSLRDVPILRHLGQGYVCLPSDAASSAFHPKLILLTGDHGGFMVVGSPNISAAGLTSNLEAVTTFAYSEKDPDEHVRRMFRWAFDYVSRLAREEGKSLFEERLDLLWQTTGWIRRDPAPGTRAAQEASGRWPMHNLDRPLLDQMAERWASVDGTEVEEGVVVSPYFDRTGLALRLQGLLRSS
jgi:hypothetical protein